MTKEMITKKELLELTNISYGQLYRWKRKGLIPEEWFNKQSTFTGQETFFPKEEILTRINKILSLKDDMGLEEIAEHLQTGISSDDFSFTDLLDKEIIKNTELRSILDINDKKFVLNEIVIIKIIDLLSNIVNDKNNLLEMYEFLNKQRDKMLKENLIVNTINVDGKMIIALSSCEVVFNCSDNVKSYNLKALLDDIKLEII